MTYEKEVTQRMDDEEREERINDRKKSMARPWNKLASHSCVASLVVMAMWWMIVGEVSVIRPEAFDTDGAQTFLLYLAAGMYISMAVCIFLMIIGMFMSHIISRRKYDV